jgi:hypothetical protein
MHRPAQLVGPRNMHSRAFFLHRAKSMLKRRACLVCSRIDAICARMANVAWCKPTSFRREEITIITHFARFGLVAAGHPWSPFWRTCTFGVIFEASQSQRRAS